MNFIKTEAIKPYILESITAKMKKEFGSISKGEEDFYWMQLFVLEETLLKFYLKNPNINSRRAKEAINICLLKIKGYINSIEYDYKGLVDTDSVSLADKLSKSFIPFENEELYNVLKASYNFESMESLKSYFLDQVKCLIRIYESVEFWEKQAGLNGYFEFLKTQILNKIDLNNDKVNFAVSKKI